MEWEVNLDLVNCCVRTSSPGDMTDGRVADGGLTMTRPVSPGMTARELFKNVAQYIKCELTEMRETAIVAFGHANDLAFRYRSHLHCQLMFMYHSHCNDS